MKRALRLLLDPLDEIGTRSFRSCTSEQLSLSNQVEELVVTDLDDIGLTVLPPSKYRDNIP